jgi:hypothetical protein
MRAETSAIEEDKTDPQVPPTASATSSNPGPPSKVEQELSAVDNTPSATNESNNAEVCAPLPEASSDAESPSKVKQESAVDNPPNEAENAEIVTDKKHSIPQSIPSSPYCPVNVPSAKETKIVRKFFSQATSYESSSSQQPKVVPQTGSNRTLLRCMHGAL